MRINNRPKSFNFISDLENSRKELSPKAKKKDVLALGARTRAYNPELDKNGGIFTIVPLLISIAICGRGRDRGDKK